MVNSGNVWWEALRGMVQVCQRAAHLQLAENVAKKQLGFVQMEKEKIEYR